MITTKGLTTEVKFGNKEKANIAVTAEHRTLTLQLLCKDKKVGDDIEDDDKFHLPKIEMEFFTLESVDVMIRALECIKSNATPPPTYPSYCLAS